MKINKQNAGWVFISCLMLGLLALSIYLGMSGWYFRNEYNSTTSLTLGKTIQLEIGANQSNAISLVLDGAFLPGEELPQIVSIKSLEDEKSLTIRAKAIVDEGAVDSFPLALGQTQNWVYNELDGYYYYNDYLTPQNKIGLCSHVVMPQNQQHASNQSYLITFVVESLDEGQEVENIWGIQQT